MTIGDGDSDGDSDGDVIDYDELRRQGWTLTKGHAKPILVSQPTPTEPPPPLSEPPPNDVRLIEKAQYIWSFTTNYREKMGLGPATLSRIVKQIEHIIAGGTPPQTTIDMIEKMYCKVISMGPM